MLRDNIVSVMKNINDTMSICPYKNFINKSIKDNPDRLDTKYGSHVEINTIVKVKIAAIIGDDVMLDASIPNDIYVIASNKNPNIDVKYVGISGVP